MVCFPFSHSLINIYLISKLVFVPSVYAFPFKSSRMYSRLRRHPTFKTIYRLATRLPLLLCRPPFSKSQLCRLPFPKSRLCIPFFAKSRICKFLIPHLFRLSQTLVSNYLLPTVRGLAFVGWQLLRSQILCYKLDPEGIQ